LRKQNCCVERI